MQIDPDPASLILDGTSNIAGIAAYRVASSSYMIEGPYFLPKGRSFGEKVFTFKWDIWEKILPRENHNRGRRLGSGWSHM